jgi:hypothetical protein
MLLRTGERRVEDADKMQIPRCGPKNMLIMLVERIERAGLDRIDLTGLDIDHLAFARNAVIRFEMVLVVKALLGSLLHDRVVERETHGVVLQEESPALPAIA